MSSRVPRKLVCPETCWGDHRQRVFQRASVQSFFEGLATQLEPPLRVARRLGFTLYT